VPFLVVVVAVVVVVLVVERVVDVSHNAGTYIPPSQHMQPAHWYKEHALIQPPINSAHSVLHSPVVVVTLVVVLKEVAFVVVLVVIDVTLVVVKSDVVLRVEVVDVVVEVVVVVVLVVVVALHSMQPKQNHCVHATAQPPHPAKGQFAVASQTGRHWAVVV
jgi:hypothetical protein